MPNDRLLSGANISHPHFNRHRGYVSASEGPRDPAARLDYMLQRLQEATHTDHGYSDREWEAYPFAPTLSPPVPFDPWQDDPSVAASDAHLTRRRYQTIFD